MQLLEELVFNHTAFWFGGGDTLERSIPPFALRAIYGVCPVNRYSSDTHPATLYRSQRPKSHPALNASGANPSEIPSTPKQDLQDSGSESVQEEGVTGGGAFFYYLSPPPPQWLQMRCFSQPLLASCSPLPQKTKPQAIRDQQDISCSPPPPKFLVLSSLPSHRSSERSTEAWSSVSSPAAAQFSKCP